MAKKKAETEGEGPAPDISLDWMRNSITENYGAFAEKNAQVKDHFDVVLHHLEKLESAVNSYRDMEAVSK